MDREAWWATVHGLQRVGQDWATSLSLFTFMAVLFPVFLLYMYQTSSCRNQQHRNTNGHRVKKPQQKPTLPNQGTRKEAAYQDRKILITQSCPTLCPPVSSVHGILQARMLEWVTFLFSSGCSQCRNQTQVSCIAGWFFTIWATREAQEYWSKLPTPSPGERPNPKIKLGSPALQADSLLAELPGKHKTLQY